MKRATFVELSGLSFNRLSFNRLSDPNNESKNTEINNADNKNQQHYRKIRAFWNWIYRSIRRFHLDNQRKLRAMRASEPRSQQICRSVVNNPTILHLYHQRPPRTRLFGLFRYLVQFSASKFISLAFQLIFLFSFTSEYCVFIRRVFYFDSVKHLTDFHVQLFRYVTITTPPMNSTAAVQMTWQQQQCVCVAVIIFILLHGVFFFFAEIGYADINFGLHRSLSVN